MGHLNKSMEKLFSVVPFIRKSEQMEVALSSSFLL